jgi:diguanylate cyclase (GGDEF)-like protein
MGTTDFEGQQYAWNWNRSLKLLVVYYVMGTALLYIAVGYYLGRRMLYAPLPHAAFSDSAAQATSAERLEAVIEAAGEAPPAAQQKKSRSGKSFNAEKELPAEWLAKLAAPEDCRSFVEASVQSLRMDVGKYRERLVTIDGEVRQCVRSPNGDKLQTAVDQLREVNSEWMDQQAQTATFLLERRHTLGDMVHLRDRLDEVLQTQALQIKSTCANIEMFDFKASPLIGARRLVIELRKLMDLAHTLRDCMQELLLTILAREGRLDSTDKALMTDTLTGLRNRAGIETFIRRWWRDDGSRVRQVSVAMFDLDGFTQIMERWGARVTDQLIACTSRLVDDMLRKYSGLDWCGRFAGQRFFIFWADTGPHAATSVVERIRQTIAQTSFELPRGSITETFSAAVTEVFPDDTSKSLFKRLNWTLREAKKAGRNCTFLYKDNEPVCVEPPEFGVRGKLVRLDGD